MAIIVIERSVGRNGVNLPADVAVIGAALVALGPDRGGAFAPPLTIDGLGQAIEAFQRFHGLPVQDGRVDPGGRTLRRLNELLNPGATPPAGLVRPLVGAAGLANIVNASTWTPVESSLPLEHVFQWTNVAGSGAISYFQIDEPVAPRWFGALVPHGLTSFDKIHIFFHPTPAQAGFQDATYQSLGNWTNIFHYLTDNMGAQFCAAGMDRVLLMPLMTQSAAQDAGVFPQRWEAIASRILGMLKTGDMSGAAPPVAISSVVVSSFSSGIVYSHQFRSRASLGGRLAGVIDFDGIISTFSEHSLALSGPLGRVIRMQQMPSDPFGLGALASQGIYPLSKPRWGGPWASVFSANQEQALLEIHGTIPQTMMFFAARRAG